MRKPAHNLMAYNSQIVVDEKFKLIAATDVSSKGSDNEQLYKMSKQTQDNLAVLSLEITADKGYYSAKELKKCVLGNVNAHVPEVNRNHVQISKGKYTREQFKYNPKMRTQEAKDIVKQRSSIVEHPFGTIKRMLGWDHFLVRGKDKVSGENALIMLCYNFMCVINIMENELFKKFIQVV